MKALYATTAASVRRGLLLTTTGLFPIFMPAQATNAPAKSDPGEAEPIALSPFTVSASLETGYAAQSDVSGSRINTKLRDVAAPITVLTKELMVDVGAHNSTDVFAFLGNVQPDDLNAAAPDINYSRQRIRGLSALDAVTLDFFPVYDDLDTYKLERMGVSRGPNALLAGIGNPAGTLTATGKAAGFANKSEIETYFTSWGGARATLDTNYVLIKNHFAVRMAYLQEDVNGAIKPSFKKDQRLFLTATAKLFQMPNGTQTTVRGNYEWVSADNLYGNVVLPLDGVTDWIRAGRPTQTNGAAGNLPGTAKLGTRIVQIPGMATLNWSGQLATNPAVASVPIFDQAVYPYTSNIKGEDGVAPDRVRQGMVYVDQQLGRNLFIQGAYFHADEINIWPIKVVGAQLNADPNTLLPDGSPNPNAGKYYVEDSGRTDTRKGRRNIERVQATYRLDFEKLTPHLGQWLGWHQLFALYEHADQWVATERLQTVNTTPLPGASSNLADVTNWIYHRSYLDYSKGIYTFTTTPYRTLVSNGGINSVAMPVLSQTTGENETQSRSFGMQNHFWQDRIIATVGTRYDANRTYSAKPVTDSRGVYPLAELNPVTFDQAVKFKPFTKSVVITPYPIKWVSFAYNESENFNSGAPALKDLFGNNLPAQGGVGKDYGVRFYLFDNKLSFSLNKFKGGSVNEQVSSINAYTDKINTIWQAIGRQDQFILTGAGTRDTQDNLTQGYEASLTYNPNQSLRFNFTGAKTESQLSHLLPGYHMYLDKNVPLWLQGSNGSLLTTAGQTIAEATAQIVSAAQTLFAQEGTQQYNMRLWTGSAVAGYTAHEGRLKGASFSINYRYYGDAVVGVPIVGGRADPAHPFKEKGYSVVGLRAAYEHKFKRQYTWYANIGIDNALNYGGHVVIMQRNGAGIPQSAMWKEGLSANLTNGLRF